MQNTHPHPRVLATPSFFTFLHYLQGTILDKSLGTNLHLWIFFQFTYVQTLPQPHRQRWTLASRIFPAFQHCIRVGEWDRTASNFQKGCTVYEGTQKLQKIVNNALLSKGLLSRIIVSTSYRVRVQVVGGLVVRAVMYGGPLLS